MKIYDTNYGPDTFGRIRMGLITEMFLTFEGYLKPEVGDHLRISCLFKGVVRDVYTVEVVKVLDCVDEPDTVLIQITPQQKIQTYEVKNGIARIERDTEQRPKQTLH